MAMKFKKVLRGYDPKEVEKYLTETANKEQQIRAAQKERIDELVDENATLRKALERYQADEKSIAKALIEAHNLANQIKVDADNYSESVLLRAKIFCAAWRAYSQTLVAALSAEEVRQFNLLQRKIEDLTAAYERDDVKEVAAALGAFSNPISKIEGEMGQQIDLKELLTPQQTLEDICAELGLSSRDLHSADQQKSNDKKQ